MSEIASARLIVHLRLLAAQFSEWRTDSENPALEVRDASLAARVLETLKGTLASAPGEIRFVAHQRQAPSGRITDFMGAWSHVEVVVGAEYLVFSDEPAATPAESLGENASLVMDSTNPRWSATLADLKLAQQADYDARKLLTATANATIGPMAAAFLYEELGPEPELLRRVEASDQPVDTRELLLMRFATEDVDELAARGLHAPLARALFRLMLPDAPARLTTRVRQAYLENVLVAGGESPALKPAELLPDPSERRKIAGALADDPSPIVGNAARWLRGDPWRGKPPEKGPSKPPRRKR